MNRKHWLLLAGLPSVGCGGGFFIVALLAIVMIGGIGVGINNLFGSNNTPPLIATPNSRPMEWLNEASSFAQRDGLPNTVVMAVIQQASDGEGFAERYYCSTDVTYGEPCNVAQPHQKGIHNVGVGEGLMGLNTHDVAKPSEQTWLSASWNLATGIQTLARYLHTGDWNTALTTFHQRVQAPPGWQMTENYADDIRSLVETYDSRPTLGAWAMASWNAKTGQWSDPQHKPETVLVVGSAPVGPAWHYQWSAPTTSCTVPPAHSTRAPQCHTVYHLLQGHALEAPMQVWGQLKNGTTVPFHLVTAANAAGGTLFEANVPLTGPTALITIDAAWTHGIQRTLPWPEMSAGGGGEPAGPVHVPPTTAVKLWWPEILVASQKSGVPPDWIASEMLNESSGNPANGSLAGAYGLMQLEPGTMDATNAMRENPQENLILGAEYLAEIYADFGSWRLTSAGYEGGEGSVEHYLNTANPRGIPWSQASAELMHYPCVKIIGDYCQPGTDNALMANYANLIWATAKTVIALHMPHDPGGPW